MSDASDPRVARKAFIGATAVAAASAAAIAACERFQTRASVRKLGKITFAVLTPSQYDYEGMMRVLRVKSPHKQVFPATSPSVQNNSNQSLYLHMQFAMNGFAFSLPGGPQHIATLGVLSGSAVLLGLKDDVWHRYKLGTRVGLAPTNIYYTARSNLDLNVSPNDPNGIYQDASAQAVLKRGGAFFLCHHALTYQAAQCSVNGGQSIDEVLKDFMANVLPGFLIVPSGVTALQLAAENGWDPYPAV